MTALGSKPMRTIYSAIVCLALATQSAKAHEVEASEAGNLGILWTLAEIIPAADCKGIQLSWTEIQNVVATGEEMMERATAELTAKMAGEVDEAPLWDDLTANMFLVPEYVRGPDGFICDKVRELFDTTKHLLGR